jgi:glutathionylspermidine synthase
MDSCLWLEPIWKALWSNKAILPLLYELEPRHPNLLPAGWDAASVGPRHVVKPILAREGANVSIVEDGRETARSEGPYGAFGQVHQQLYDLPAFAGSYPVLGVWTVGGEAAGLGIREGGRITGDEARFVPHIIEG